MDQLQCNSGLAPYLVANGACTQEVADELARVAKALWTPLGIILINSKSLRLKEVAAILSAQADQPGSLFGEVAVTLGLCSEEDIADAMKAQVADCPHVLDMALESPNVDQVKLMDAVRAYVRQTERVLARLSDSLSLQTG